MLAKQSIRPSSLLNHAHWYWVLAWFICCFYGDWPSTVIWKHTSIIHIQPHILVLGLGLGHMLFLWWLTMYRHMKAYIHHPYSIMHIGIGPWLGSYVFLLLTDYVLTYLDHPYSITHIILYIYILGLGLGHVMFLWWLTICIYTIFIYMYIYINICTCIYHIYVYI